MAYQADLAVGGAHEVWSAAGLALTNTSACVTLPLICVASAVEPPEKPRNVYPVAC